MEHYFRRGFNCCWRERECALLIYSFIVTACLCHILLISKALCFIKYVLQSSNVILSAVLHFKQSDIPMHH